jgi:hypothetical protein
MPGEPPKPQDASSPRPSQGEDARRVVEDYANSLREIIRRLRRRLN